MIERLSHCIVAIYILICSVYCQDGANSSLTFVIDNTVSMAKDIKMVIKCADEIFNTVVNSNKSEIGNFVIVTFNDPDYELRITTNKKEEFKDSLQKIRAYGGGDCPEKSMSGIELGLKSSQPFSYIFVFTDASAKDTEKFEFVKNLALNLNIKIHFILTEVSCPGDKNPDFKPYETLASKTGGDFFIMRKNNIPEILEYVKRLIGSKKVEILRRNFSPEEEKKVNVTLDSTIKDLLVTVTGDKPVMHVRDKLNATVLTEDVAKTKRAKIVAWNNTEPGAYHIALETANSTMNTLLIIRGTSKVTFTYGFSVLKPEYMNETTNRPVADKKSYVLIKLKTEGVNVNLQRIQVVDLKEKILLDKPMTIIEKDDLCYISEPIAFPKDTFKIVMIAEDEETKEIIKRNSLPIEPQKVLPGTIKDEAPKVTITGDAKVMSSYASPVKLTCRVTGHPKPNIIWTDELGSPLKFTVLTLREEYEFLSVLDIDKVKGNNTYICKASNSISSEEKTVKVEMKKFFNVVNLSKDKKVEYGKEEKIYCKVNSSPPAKVTWLLNGKEVNADDNISISPDQSTLLIRKMKPEYVGKIFCEVRNLNNERLVLHNMQLIITGIEAPKIDNKITEISINKGSNATISCRILKGKPNPTIQWYFKAKNKDSFYPIEEFKEDIRIDKVTANVVGTYKCIAKNEIDKDSHIVDLVMEYTPVIKGKNHIDVVKEIGKSVTIHCEIQGEPAPKINWSINGAIVENTEIYKIYKDHTLTFKASIKTMGEYSCEGVNKLGSVKTTANVSVFEPVSFDIPSDSMINIKSGQTLDMLCPVKGFPRPKTQWVFYSNDSKEQSVLSETDHLVVSTIQERQNGLYVCIAKNPFCEEKSLTYIVNVQVPPSIKPEVKIEAVEGDISTRIPCNTIGHPKPTIRWLFEGNPLATGNEFYDMDSDGTLIIKSVRKTVSGNYVCVAESSFGEVFGNFKLTVDAYPRKGGKVSQMYLETGKSAVVKCNVPHTATDKVRWYQGRYLKAHGDLVINRYSRSDTYKCRVSNYYNSVTGTVRIKTGFKPRFAFPLEEKQVMFYDPDPCLNCGYSANPKPKISWWKNKNKIVFSDDNYCCYTAACIGEYECLVENELGKINRTFYIAGDDCLLDIKDDLDRYHPLVLNEDNKFPAFSVKDGHLAIPFGHSAQFFCQDGFNKFTNSLIKAECVNSQTFKINGEQVLYPKLKCKEALQPVTIRTDKNCANGNGEIFKIGINVTMFLEVYKICFHKKLKIPLYGEYELTALAAGVNCASPETWFNGDVLNYNKDEMYDCKQQRNYLSGILGRDLPGKEDECFGARQLVNERDVPAGFPQMLTHSYLNVIPHWNSDIMKNWDVLEELLRKVVRKRHTRYTRSTITIRTGIFQNFRQIIGKSIAPSNIYISDKAGYKNILPVFLWKVITDQLSAASVAIIQVTIPESLIGDDIKKFEICPNKCDRIEWIKEIDADYLQSGYMYCCSIVEFEKAFSHRVLFSVGYSNLLSVFTS